VLKRHEATTKKVKVLFKSIVGKAHQRAQSDDEYCPENLAQSLLVEGSLAVASAYPLMMLTDLQHTTSVC
jgi:hypothetical protein